MGERDEIGKRPSHVVPQASETRLGFGARGKLWGAKVVQK